jgi:hypothetical protein
MARQSTAKTRRGVCVVCRGSTPTGIMCDSCKADLHRLNQLRRYHRAEECEADRERKPFRVDFYRRIVALGGTLFEGAPS